MTVSHKKLGLLFILVGPTGAGKNTIMNGVLTQMDTIRQLPTATTRDMRDNEKEGREHHFVTRETFEQMIVDKELLEWQEVHGRLYGVPRGTVEQLINDEQDRIADIDVLGALLVRSLYPDNVVLVFVQPASTENMEDIVRERLSQRGDTPEEIERRLPRIQMEMQLAPLCDYLIINDDLNTSIQDAASIIRAERARRKLENLRVEQDQPRHRLVQTAIALGIVDGQVLCHDNHLPRERVHRSELPHEAALRALEPYTPNGDTAQQPLAITVQHHAYYDEIAFWYSFKVEAVPPPDDAGWQWQPLNQLDLPPIVQEQLSTP